MADFHQEGIITTLHALYEAFDREKYLANLEKKLEEYSRHLRISLLLPSLYAEMQSPQVLDPILEQIQKVRYLHTIVVALGGAPEQAQFQEAKEYFGKLRTPERDLKVVWVEGPRIKKIFEEIPIGSDGYTAKLSSCDDYGVGMNRICRIRGEDHIPGTNRGKNKMSQPLLCT